MLRHGSVEWQDPILKEGMFGLTNSEANHGEDVREYYFYIDSTPTHSYMKYLYKYPQAEYPYTNLIEINRLFYEYFHGDNGAGLGASHQTGWTGLVAKMIELFGRIDGQQLLNAGKAGAFSEGVESSDRLKAAM